MNPISISKRKPEAYLRSEASESKKCKINNVANESLKIAKAFSVPSFILKESVILTRKLDKLLYTNKEKRKEKKQQKYRYSLSTIYEYLKTLDIKQCFDLAQCSEVKQVYFLGIAVLIKRAHKPSYKKENLHRILTTYYLDEVIQCAEKGYISRLALIESWFLKKISLNNDQKERIFSIPTFEILPQNIMRRVLSFCSHKALFSVMHVNRSWRSMALSDPRMQSTAKPFHDFKKKGSLNDIEFSTTRLLRYTKLSERELSARITHRLKGEDAISNDLLIGIFARIIILSFVLRPNPRANALEFLKRYCFSTSCTFDFSFYFATLFANKQLHFSDLLADINHKIYRTKTEITRDHFHLINDKIVTREEKKAIISVVAEDSNKFKQLIISIKNVREERLKNLISSFINYASEMRVAFPHTYSKTSQIIIQQNDFEKFLYFKEFIRSPSHDEDYILAMLNLLFAFSNADEFVERLTLLKMTPSFAKYFIDYLFPREEIWIFLNNLTSPKKSDFILKFLSVLLSEQSPQQGVECHVCKLIKLLIEKLSISHFEEFLSYLSPYKEVYRVVEDVKNEIEQEKTAFVSSFLNFDDV